MKQFAEQGYDIYDINSEFYNDFCSPANIGGNDITLEDRKKDIYPYNITFCKSNCKYKGINIDEQRVICSCDINSDNTINEEDEFVKDNGNFKSYLMDKINYKIFKCYKLFFNGNNLKKTHAFYIILIIYIILLILNSIYIFHSLEKLKIQMARELFAVKLTDKRINTEFQKINEIKKFKDSNYANPLKKVLE